MRTAVRVDRERNIRRALNRSDETPSSPALTIREAGRARTVARAVQRKKVRRSKGREPMPQVLIPCPVTGDLVPTGVQVTTLEDVEPEGNLLIACPECGRDHEWTRKDAVLAAN